MTDVTEPAPALAGTAALVTRAGSSWGRAVAGQLAAEGAVLVLADPDGDALDETADAIEDDGGEVVTVVGDLSLRVDCDRLVAAAVATYEELDALVFGFEPAPADAAVTGEAWDLALAANVTAAFWIARATRTTDAPEPALVALAVPTTPRSPLDAVVGAARADLARMADGVLVDHDDPDAAFATVRAELATGTAP